MLKRGGASHGAGVGNYGNVLKWPKRTVLKTARRVTPVREFESHRFRQKHLQKRGQTKMLNFITNTSYSTPTLSCFSCQHFCMQSCECKKELPFVKNCNKGEPNMTLLKNIHRGETFEYCNVTWMVLEHDKLGHTLAITNSIIENTQIAPNEDEYWRIYNRGLHTRATRKKSDFIQFDNHQDYSNNWKKSSIRKYLNDEFLKQLCGDKSPRQLGFSKLVTDLTDFSGLKNYGESKDFVSLLTFDMYRKHRDILDEIYFDWWLATPRSSRKITIDSSKRWFDDDLHKTVLYITEEGAKSSTLANDNKSVRPVCYLDSNIKVVCPE